MSFTTGGTSRVVETKYDNYTSSTRWQLGEPRIVTESRAKSPSTVLSQTSKTRYEWLSNGLLRAVWTLPPNARDEDKFPASLTADDTPSDGDLIKLVKYTYVGGGSIAEIVEEAWDKSSSTSGPTSRSTVFKHDFPSGNPDYVYPSEIVDSVFHSTRLEYHPTLGRVLEKTDPNNVVTRHSYDGLGRLVGVAQGGGATTVTSFELPPTTLASQSPFAFVTTSSTGAISKVVVDYLQRDIASYRLLLDGIFVERLFTYNAAGDLYSASLPRRVGTTGAPSVTTYNYDALGRRVKATRPALVAKTWTYPDAFTVNEFEGQNRSTYQAFDVDGYLTTSTAPYTSALRGGTTSRTSFTYDATGLPLTVKLWNSPTAPDDRLTRTMTYDALGRLRTLDDPGTGSHEYRYNGFGDIRWYKDGDAASGERRVVRDMIGRVTRNEGLTMPRRDDEFVWDQSAHGRGKLASTRSIVRSTGTDNGISIDRSDNYDDFGRLNQFGIADGWESTRCRSSPSTPAVGRKRSGTPATSCCLVHRGR